MIRRFVYNQWLAGGRSICIAFLPMATLLVLCCGTFTGCHFSPPKSASLWPWKKDTPPVTPDRLLTVWSDSVLHQPGQPGVRGFGGRIYFYQADGTEPVKVDGGMAVYAFDADHLDPYQQKPVRKYAFSADQMAEHLSGTPLGPSYSLWLPWDEVGGPARRLSLIARFEGRNGGTVISDPVIKLLPGMPQQGNAETDSSSPNNPGPVRVVGHQKQVSEPVVPPSALRGRGVQTIDLPPSFHKHLKDDPRPPSLPVESPGIWKPNDAGLPSQQLPSQQQAAQPPSTLEMPQLQLGQPPTASSELRHSESIQQKLATVDGTYSAQERENIRQGQSINPPRKPVSIASPMK